ncbi:MAG: hypothetical protein N3D84_03485, partial [Candidatus Woesearchaeota archaeon]|nr:hypothetical protein [Candidatus Woesearchaeota archaeon]
MSEKSDKKGDIMQMDFIRRSNTKRFKDLNDIVKGINNSLKNSLENPALSVPSFEYVAKMMLEHAMLEVHASSGSIMLAESKNKDMDKDIKTKFDYFNEDNEKAKRTNNNITDKTLKIFVSIGINERIANGIEIGPESNTISRIVFDRGIPLYQSTYPDLKSKVSLKEFFYDPNSSGSFMSLPLLTINGIEGVVNINAAAGNQFRKVDLSYGLLFTTYMGVVKSKFDLLEKVKRQKGFLQENKYEEFKDKEIGKIIEETNDAITDLAVVGFLSILARQNPWVYQHSTNVKEYAGIIA